MQKHNQFSMKIVGIDFGLRKVGLAIAEGKLAEPLMVIKYSSQNQLIEKIKRIIEERGIDRVVVGVSEGEMAERAREFGEELKEFVKVDFYDETLTTHDAIKLSISAGLGRKKRKSLEDAYAASIMLQGYLDR